MTPAHFIAAQIVVAKIAWARLSPNTRGALLMLTAALLFSAMGVLVKVLGQRLDSFQVAFFRAAFGLATILPFALAAGRGALATRRPFMHLFRGAIGAIAMFSGFYSITHLPLADAAAYSFTKPLFLVVLAALFLGERVRARRLGATAAGFIGVMIMLRPQNMWQGQGIEFAAIVALIGAALVATIVVTVKTLMRTERPVAIMFYFGVLSTLFTLLPALFVWRAPTWPELGLLMAVGALGASAQSLLIRAYGVAEATAIAPFDYTRLIYSAFFGFLIFAEIPTWSMLAGAAVIVGSTLYIARREALLAEHGPLDAETPR